MRSNRLHVKTPFIYIASCAGVGPGSGFAGLCASALTGMTDLDMLQLWLLSQLHNMPTFIFQQDESPAHFHCEVRQYLNTALPGLLEMTNH
jgi:hypothetical protein